MRRFVIGLISVIAMLAFSTGWSASKVRADLPSAHSQLESVLQDAYASDEPGASAIVILNGEILYRGSRGLANLELAVPLAPESVLRIGSVTKQFTAAAILTLVRDGKLRLSDPLTKLLPDYPTQGYVVTVQHLLSHTSGIANYTELPEWATTMRSDVTVQQLIDVFKDKPFDFSPGEQLKYDNSGYVLLGAIIEQVSGQSYGDFLRTEIFEPLAMKNTKVDDSRSLVHHRAAGYERRDDQWINADYLSMTHPYSAGALITNIDDLARWNAAIENHQLLPSALWERATSSFSLSDGTSTRYAGGWIMGRIGSLASIEHGGGINGFNAYVLRVPSKRLYVAVLANASPPRTPPQRVALNLATTALGTSLDTPEVPIDSKRLEQYVGTYQLASNGNRHVNRTGNRLFLVTEDEKRLELTPIGHDLFEAREDHSQVRFMRRNGRITALTVEQRILMRDRAPAQRVAQ